MALNKIKIDYVEIFPSLVDFTIIYPNGGTEAAPANVSINQRYVESNPFPGEHVICKAEIFFGGAWVDPGFFASSTTVAHGVSAGQVGDNIIVRTAATGLILGGQVSGSPADYTAVTTYTTPTPVRVKVWKVSPLPA